MNMQILLAVYHNPFFRAALYGALVAARVDYIAFQKFPSGAEALKYDWKVAAWRWFQGAVVGAVTANILG
jgi:hypothetical protein